MKRDFINIKDLTPVEIKNILALTAKLKKSKSRMSQELKGKSIGLIFQKSSNRTRVSFEVAISQLGGNCIYLGPKEISLGKRETTSDVARTLSRYLDGIVARTFTHKDIMELARTATIPVINGLSDLSHPCQALADIFSIQEKFGKLKGITIAYVGDGNNVCNSLLMACSKIGMNINIATPPKYEVTQDVISRAQKFAKESGAVIKTTHSPQEAVKGAQVIYADTWVSMGQEDEEKKRLEDFKGYQVDGKLASLADKNYIFMHCLPAHRGQEVTEEVIDGSHSIIFDEAENRLHVQKAILIFLYKNSKSRGKK
jgi:ornithine carbamoyltransferase